MSQDLQAIQENVYTLLLKYPKFRSPYMRKQFHVKYWREFDGLGDLMENVLMKEYPHWTSSETLSRCIRKVFELHPNIKPAPVLEQKRFELVEEHRQTFRKGQ